jgi:hypothetical protein
MDFSQGIVRGEREEAEAASSILFVPVDIKTEPLSR